MITELLQSMARMMPLLEKMWEFDEFEQVQSNIRQMFDLMEKALKIVEEQYKTSVISRY